MDLHRHKQKQLKDVGENVEQIKQRELDKQRRHKQLQRQAEQWLKNLDPYSDEGLWFTEFAYAYDTQLEAAIEYLDALN
ncbi:MAG: hypothetical protein HC796_01990 [Synechococcaceae cyanobacterium RL_1_2]|nr:hypothetical protein [Synechococcaceae cyanobacterium RL_1_2]